MAGTADPTGAAPEPAPSPEPVDATPGRPRRWAVALGRLLLLLVAAGVLFELSGSSSAREQPQAASGNQPVQTQATRLVNQGRQIFRFDTFGSEKFWGGSLKLHRAVAGAANGGVGPGLSPRAALGVGLKVDVDALPPELQQALQRGEVDLDDTAVTLALLKLQAAACARWASSAPCATPPSTTRSRRASVTGLLSTPPATRMSTLSSPSPPT